MIHVRRSAAVAVCAAAALGLAGCGEDDTTATGETTDERTVTTATASIDEARSDDFERTVDLGEYNDSGITGEATVSRENADEVRIKVEVDDESARADVIVRQGDCTDAGAADTVTSTDGDSGILPSEPQTFELAPLENGRSESTVPLSEDLLVPGDYALIVLASSEAETGTVTSPSVGDEQIAACAVLTIE